MDQHIALHWMTIATDLNLWQCNKQKGFQTVTVTAYMFWWPKWVLQIYEAHGTKWFKKIWQSIRQNGKVDLIAKHVEQWDNILCKLLRTFLSFLILSFSLYCFICPTGCTLSDRHWLSSCLAKCLSPKMIYQNNPDCTQSFLFLSDFMTE